MTIFPSSFYAGLERRKGKTKDDKKQRIIREKYRFKTYHIESFNTFNKPSCPVNGIQHLYQIDEIYESCVTRGLSPKVELKILLFPFTGIPSLCKGFKDWIEFTMKISEYYS